MAGNTVITAVLGIAVGLTLIFNGVFLLTFVKRGRMKKPVIIFLICLAFVDTLAVVLWTLFAVIASTSGEWALPDAICPLQVYFMGFCNAVNMHILTVLMFERFLKIFMPSKHQEIIFDTVVLLAIAGIFLFDGVIASFPTWGWGQTAYFSTQYQCAISFEENVSQLHFTLAVHFGVPVILIVCFYLASLIRLKMIRRKLQPGQAIVLEENMEICGDGFSERLKRQYLKFKNPGEKSKQPKIESRIDSDGFRRESDESSDDDEMQLEQFEATNFENGGKPSTRRKRSKRKTHYLSRDDVLLMHMIALVCLVYFICWGLYITQSYIYTFSPKTLKDWLVIASVCMSHYGSCIKVPFYLIYPRIRNALKKTLGIGSGHDNKVGGAEPEEKTTEF